MNEQETKQPKKELTAIEKYKAECEVKERFNILQREKEKRMEFLQTARIKSLKFAKTYSGDNITLIEYADEFFAWLTKDKI